MAYVDTTVAIVVGTESVATVTVMVEVDDAVAVRVTGGIGYCDEQ